MFMVFTPILLLNMLIAMMGNTYCEVITQSEKEWVKQWANIIVALERAIHHTVAKEFIQTYSIKMPSTEKDIEVRGVIVIKAKPKSKAKEKKTALSLWKRLGKRTVQELRKVGGSAVEVRRRYNLFRSKQPTARLRMGKVVQEWNPAPQPVFPPIPAPTISNVDNTALNAGFNDLLSQVASASGIDIDKPIDIDTVQNETGKINSEGVKSGNLQEYNNTDNSKEFINLAIDSNSDTKPGLTSFDQKLQSNVSNQPTLQSNPIQQHMLQSSPVTQGIQQFNPTAKGMEQSNLTTQRTLHVNLPTQVIQQQNPQTQGSLQPNFTTQSNQHSTLQSNQTSQGMLHFNPTTQALLQIPQGMLQSNPVLQGNLQSNVTSQGILHTSPSTYAIHQSNEPAQGMLQKNCTVEGEIQINSITQQGILSNQNEGNRSNMKDYNLQSENAQRINPSSLSFSEKVSDVKTHSEQLQPMTMNDDKGISVSIQTRIISTRITKARSRRRKDSVFPARNDYSDSTSEKETKRGFLLHRKDNALASNFKGASKYKKKRKRNQISFQEKISVDNVPYNIPLSRENELNKPNK